MPVDQHGVPVVLAGLLPFRTRLVIQDQVNMDLITVLIMLDLKLQVGSLEQEKEVI